MDEGAFRDLLAEHLLPMLAGTRRGIAKPSSARHALVAYESPVALLMKPSVDQDYRVQLLRSQAFTSEEKVLVKLLITELGKIAAETDTEHLADFMT